MEDKKGVKTTPLNAPPHLGQPSNASYPKVAPSTETTKNTVTPIQPKPIVSHAFAAPSQEPVLPSVMDCASTYTSTSSTTPAQQEGAASAENKLPPVLQSPFHSTPVWKESIPLPMDTEPLFLPNHDDNMCHDMHSGNTATAMYHARQQASDLSHLLDDFVQDWLPNAGAETTFVPTTSTSQQQYETPWQDQSLRGMLDLILTNEEPVASVVVPL